MFYFILFLLIVACLGLRFLSRAGYWSEQFDRILEEARKKAKQRWIMEWKPIETAPMDCNYVLLYRPEIMFVGYYGGANSGWRINAPGLPSMWPIPTHWMPLPKMPKMPNKCYGGKRHHWKDGWICERCGVMRADHEERKRHNEELKTTGGKWWATGQWLNGHFLWMWIAHIARSGST